MNAPAPGTPSHEWNVNWGETSEVSHISVMPMGNEQDTFAVTHSPGWNPSNEENHPYLAP